MFKISSKAAPKIFKEIAQIVLKLLFILICFFILLFPVINFKINLESVIFPACEIILIYYCTSLYGLSLGIIFLAGILCDSLYSMPLGTNSLVFLTAHLLFKLAARFFLVKNYLTNFIIFCVYCFFILNFRCLLVSIKKLNSDDYVIVLFQYLTTIFFYNLIRFLLDPPLDYFKKNVKQKNIT
ncbi:hypothetical protein [Rickettsia endosymbiont of Halotydeus destructor]|uniref:hypothetical protein n=1 Tax=Rickettsia endosymbiont of Halotydeus destructor TaxID=2996754 RepID=UPI003BAF5B6A